VFICSNLEVWNHLPPSPVNQNLIQMSDENAFTPLSDTPLQENESQGSSVTVTPVTTHQRVDSLEFEARPANPQDEEDAIDFPVSDDIPECPGYLDLLCSRVEAGDYEVERVSFSRTKVISLHCTRN